MKNIEKDFIVVENRQLTHKTFKIRLKGDLPSNILPGQFVNIAIPGKYLRRPVSIHDIAENENELVLLYDVAGQGTMELSQMKPESKLNLLLNLGNGFSIPEKMNHPVLLGGGIGCAPLFYLAKFLMYQGIIPEVILGFNTAADSFGMEKELLNIGIPCYIATVDGSSGTKGFVTDVIFSKNLKFDYFYACGPMPMLKALSLLEPEGQLSLECRMGCGFGACMCCSIETTLGAKRICKEGPVFNKSELIWK